MTYSRVSVEPSGEVDYALQVSVKDLSEALGLESDRTATVAEIRAGKDRLLRYFLERVRIEAGGKPCPIDGQSVDNVEDEIELRAELRFTGRCPAEAHALAIGYDLFFDLDPQHMGKLEVAHAGKTSRVELTSEARRFEFDIRAPAPPVAKSDVNASRVPGVEQFILWILLVVIAAVAGKTWLLPRLER